MDITLNNGDYLVGWIEAGEWLKYVVTVPSTGTYDLALRVARAYSGSSSVHLEVDGRDVTGFITVPSTGGWFTWKITLPKPGFL